MCMGCYDDYFKDGVIPVPPTTAAMAWLAGFIAGADIDGGLEFSGLHIVIADWNLEDHNIQYCREQEHKLLTLDQDALAVQLLELSEAERHVVMKIAEDAYRAMMAAQHSGQPTSVL